MKKVELWYVQVHVYMYVIFGSLNFCELLKLHSHAILSRCVFVSRMFVYNKIHIPADNYHMCVWLHFTG